MKRNFKITLVALAVAGLPSCSTTKTNIGQEEKKFEIGYFTTFSASGVYGYDFINDSDVIYRWSSDLFRFKRIGKYKTLNDTIKIDFEPLIKFRYAGSELGLTILEIKNLENQNLSDFPVKIFQGDQPQTIVTDSSGIAKISSKIELIDSIYFNWQFEEFGFYPIDNKYIPSESKPEGELMTGYVRLQVIIDEELIQHPINTNSATILIIGKNKLFNGVNYDPEILYLGGILTKK